MLYSKVDYKQNLHRNCKNRFYDSLDRPPNYIENRGCIDENKERFDKGFFVEGCWGPLPWRGRKGARCLLGSHLKPARMMPMTPPVIAWYESPWLKRLRARDRAS